jgi:hypothetical protein
LLLTIGLVLAIPLRVPLAEWLLRSQLPSLGLPQVEGTVRELSLNQLVIENLLVEKEQARIKRLTATYSLRGLLAGRIEDLILEEPTLLGSLEGARPRFPLLETLLESEDSGATGSTTPPLDRLEARDARIILDTARGPITITSDAVFSPRKGADKDGWSISLKGAANGPGLEAKGKAEAEVSPEGAIRTASGTLSGQLTNFLVEDLTLTTDLNGSFDGATLRAESSGLTLQVRTLAPEVLAALPEASRATLSAPLSLSLGDRSRPTVLTLDLRDESKPVQLSGPLSLGIGTGEAGALNLAIKGWVDLALPDFLGDPNPARISGTAKGTARVTALPIDGLADGVDGTLGLFLALDGAGGATLTMDKGGRIQVEGLSPALTRVLDLLGPHNRPSLTLVEGPTQLSRSPDGRIETTGALTLQPQAEGPGHLTVSFDGLVLPEGNPRVGTVKEGHVTVTELAPPGVTGLSGNITLSDGAWSATEASAQVTSEATAATYSAEALSLSGLHQTGTASIHWESASNRLTAESLDSTLSLEAINRGAQALRGLELDWRGSLSLAVGSGLLRGQPDQLTLTLEEGTLEEGVSLTAPLSLSLSAPTTLSARTDTGQVTLAKTQFAPTTLALMVNGEALAASNLSMAVSGPWPPGPGSPLALELSDGSLRGFGLSARALTGDFSLEQGGPRGSLSALVDQLPGEATAAKGARPLTLDLSLSHPDPGADTKHFPLRARLTDPKKRLSIGLEGWTTANLTEGRLRLAARPVAFAPEGLQPAALHSALSGVAKLVTGTLALKGTLSWRGSTLSPDLSILAKDVTATLGDVPMEKINGVIHLTQFWPPRGPSQDISVGTVSLGLPLGNALIRYSLDGKGHLLIENASLDLAGGTVTTENVAVPLTGGQILVPLEVKAVALDQLAELTNLDGLAASGSLGGRIPLRVEPDGTIWVDKATLETETPGHLSYHPPEAPEVLAAGNQGVLLLLLALDDFRYQHLKLSLDGESSGELTIGINLLGANPDLYDGYPVDLNVNLTGALTELIRKNLRTYTLPSRIQDNLEQFMNSLGYTGTTAPTVP